MMFLKNIFMDALNRLKDKHQIKKKIKIEVLNEIAKLKKDIDDLLATDGFIDLNIQEYKDRYSSINDKVEISCVPLLNRFNARIKELDKLNIRITSLEGDIKKHNDDYAKTKIEDAYSIIGKVENKKLDEQQMIAIVKDYYNQLVIAGAGTGKTTTIIGKVKYLIMSENVKPEEILLLSFTNASAAEMKERLIKELNIETDVMTFHKFGLEVIKSSGKIVPNICSDSRTIIKDSINKCLNEDEYSNKLIYYLYFNRVITKSEFDFTNEDEYKKYLKINPPKTINNENVKSYGEMQIANFLLYNGVQYVYENEYKYETNNEDYGAYHPDFYLPKYDIYIEYYGIDRNNDVPSYFKDTHGKSAKDFYNDEIKWKRSLHKKNNTILVETFYYEMAEGNLLSNLKEKLENLGVKMTPKNNQELWDEITYDRDELIEGLVGLFCTIISLMKTNNYDINKLKELNNNNCNKYMNDLIIELVEPIYSSYKDYLKENKMIDFNDMINSAKDCIDNGKYVHEYKYVIVDEYQDISKSRYELLKSLRNMTNYNLFCVGDDWQSIYRFNGSDVDYIVHFEKYWGITDVNKIETTYRFNDKIIDISSRFIMANPYQIKKSLKSSLKYDGIAIGEISGYKEFYSIQFLSDKLNDLPKDSTVFFIGRYNFDYEKLSSNKELHTFYDYTSKRRKVVYEGRKDLNMEFLTAHGSKGLEADYVFIINNLNNKLGFPSRIEDSPIIDLLLQNNSNYPFDEERRLFYVALTRARKKVFLVTVLNNLSIFAKEICLQHAEEIKREKYECPKCGGILIRKNGPHGEFLGCTNYQSCGCTYTRKIKRKKNNI